MAYCGAESPSGWLCVLKKGHEGEHMSINNQASWKGTPGRPLFWGEEAPRVSVAQRKRESRVVAVIQGNKPQFTGRPCEQCGSMNTIPNGKCTLCLEPHCGFSGECS